jgi:hypothetical protein
VLKLQAHTKKVKTVWYEDKVVQRKRNKLHYSCRSLNKDPLFCCGLQLSGFIAMSTCWAMSDKSAKSVPDSYIARARTHTYTCQCHTRILAMVWATCGLHCDKAENLHYLLATPNYRNDRLCGLMVKIHGYRSRGPGSIPDATRFSRECNWGATSKKRKIAALV